MISAQELRRAARERGLALDLVEKDYALGWLLYGIASSSISSRIAFKGGTALSKVYFPGDWRLSEDLDFTLLDDGELSTLIDGLSDEVSRNVREASDISVVMKKTPFNNPNYLQSRIQYSGPISKNTVKIEVSRERFVGPVVKKSVPRMFDYPAFEVRVYSLDNILAEKIRTLLERGKVKDYYDVWKILKAEKFESRQVKSLFLEKCKANGISFVSAEQIFPADLANRLAPHMKIGLTRLSSEPLPSINDIITELRTQLTPLLGK
ncbi:MAG: nucleotidyl transferase AbiEii/AbiGii toxin family protein [Nitrososphaerota archaeon]|nr:nucleotidyl transferase AbiEii/AbiGii toxin family protein [Nitrososphaerota archaeon]MDG6922218.1 nucleotidyl transferase AbiEii/AbiGii toxin family protein [Nitrososphaerota archaeon]